MPTSWTIAASTRGKMDFRLLGSGGKLSEKQAVERDVAAHSAPMNEFHQRRQVGDGEIFSRESVALKAPAEVDGVGANFEGRTWTLPNHGGARIRRATAARGVARGWRQSR